MAASILSARREPISKELTPAVCPSFQQLSSFFLVFFRSSFTLAPAFIYLFLHYSLHAVFVLLSAC